MGQDPNQRGSFFSIATKVSLNLQEYIGLIWLCLGMGCCLNLFSLILLRAK